MIRTTFPPSRRGGSTRPDLTPNLALMSRVPIKVYESIRLRKSLESSDRTIGSRDRYL